MKRIKAPVRDKLFQQFKAIIFKYTNHDLRVDVIEGVETGQVLWVMACQDAQTFGFDIAPIGLELEKQDQMTIRVTSGTTSSKRPIYLEHRFDGILVQLDNGRLVQLVTKHLFALFVYQVQAISREFVDFSGLVQ